MSLLPIKLKLNEVGLDDAVQKAASFINRGCCVIYPTDTIYGVGVDAYDYDSVEKLFKIKKRSENKPVSVLVRDIEMIKEVAYINDRQEIILKSLLPGPYTFILASRGKVQKKLCAGTSTIGVRIPENFFCSQLIKKLNVPITASSANVSGMENKTNIEDILKQFKENSITPDLFIDNGEVSNSNPSTVIDITQDNPKILRGGKNSFEVIKKLTSILGE